MARSKALPCNGAMEQWSSGAVEQGVGQLVENTSQTTKR